MIYAAVSMTEALFPGWHPRRTGGFRDEAHRDACHAGLRAFWRRGGGPRCGAARRSDAQPCGFPVRVVGLRCWLHAGTGPGRVRRARRLDPEQSTPEQIARAVRRAALNRLSSLWRKDPWAAGLTLDLGDHEDAFRAALAAAGWPVERVPYAVADWARWKWRRAFLDGRQVPDIWRDALAAMPARVPKAGRPPTGWAWSEPAAPGGMAYTLPVRLPVGSKRRLPDPVREPRPATPPAALSAGDEARAVIALRDHADTLAPALALTEDNGARLRLALAFARLGAGEIDYLDWLDALAAAQGR